MLTRGASPRLDEIAMNCRGGTSVEQNALFFHCALHRRALSPPDGLDRSVVPPCERSWTSSEAPMFLGLTRVINRAVVGASSRLSHSKPGGRQC